MVKQEGNTRRRLCLDLGVGNGDIFNGRTDSEIIDDIVEKKRLDRKNTIKKHRP